MTSGSAVLVTCANTHYTFLSSLQNWYFAPGPTKPLGSPVSIIISATVGTLIYTKGSCQHFDTVKHFQCQHGLTWRFIPDSHSICICAGPLHKRDKCVHFDWYVYFKVWKINYVIPSTCAHFNIFHPSRRNGVFIWQNFQPACRDLGSVCQDLA